MGEEELKPKENPYKSRTAERSGHIVAAFRAIAVRELPQQGKRNSNLKKKKN